MGGIVNKIKNTVCSYVGGYWRYGKRRADMFRVLFWA